MNPTQEAIFSIYKVFRQICLDHDLTYFGNGGTAIGALRHKGFIPWDDDLDVCMPIEDMMRFIKICQDELPERYQIKSYFTDEHYPLAFIKVVDTQTTQIEYTFQHIPEFYSGVWIDIFPICSVSDNQKERDAFVGSIVKDVQRINFYSKRQFYMSVKDLMKERISWGIMGACIKPFKKVLRSRHFAKRILDKMLSHPFYGSDSTYVYALQIRVLLREWLSDSVEVPFEDSVMPLFKGYDAYLRANFGDYMTPPKPEDIYHHYCFVDLEHPYQEYVEGKRTFQKRSN